MKLILRLLLLTSAAGIGAALLITPAAAQTLVLPKSKLAPAAKITVTLGKDSNHNTTVDLKAQFLAQPDSLHPPQQYYMVWVQPHGAESQAAPRPKGILAVDKNRKGEVKFITPATNFDLIITAEHVILPEHPSEVEIVRGAVARAEQEGGFLGLF